MSQQARPAIDETIEIARPIGTVWDTITDWERAADWLPNVSECQGTAATGVGVELPFRYQGQPALAVIEQVRSPEHLVIRRPNGPVDAVFTYDLVATAEGTSVHLRAELRSLKGIGLVTWLLGKFLARTDRDQLRRLKEVAERP
ncbi:MAG TPA: SRPBCC family protein [Acidimicrobiales bacterium]|nr:SRPBCC family protein [Acidimicrobiales bacterium]